MEIYLVGGAVRDRLMNLPSTDRDWVIVGSSSDEMAALGYLQVGRDFPVFLHPESREEYALARTERKTGPGHGGFEFDTGPRVKLEEDLSRRDLTINAMAEDSEGNVIDPFGGRADLERKCLRHVSSAFAEDPLRVFRLARFAAQLPGFSVAEETLTFARNMADNDELAELSAERVWQEWCKSLGCEEPSAFLSVLQQCHALDGWFRELRGLDLTYPGALDSPVHRFASLGWAIGSEAIKTLAERLKAPNEFRRLANRVAIHGSVLARWREARAQEVYLSVKAADGFKPDGGFEDLLTVVEACSGENLVDLATLCSAIRVEVVAAPFAAAGVSGA
ncbi:MAG: multifunctional CCA tRNA nucleotidyl transferase/2'3'-cyclic phosphodiesterase/2'nucleotidase/phosphatase [Gammaproteobacteria bacterium]|nr:multifunctional CCA tRNA nucleotidyl transferase/2'3'-cyclic phosphodiesterase/2'nucleotidase/phosphatase [Gammaproteobacteria bacterium]